MKDISQILKADIKIEDGIFCCMNDHFVSGDNQKYMKMYDWMSFFYDFPEKLNLKCKTTKNNVINSYKEDYFF